MNLAQSVKVWTVTTTAIYSCNHINVMCVLGEQMSSDVDFDFYIGLDDVMLTYCLPCNFDVLNEPGCYIMP